MRFLAEVHDAGIVHTASYSMKLPNTRAIWEPDIIFVTADHRSRITRNYLDGPADIAVEVISPESRTRDRREKLFEYARGGVREYWLLDYELQRAEFKRLGDDGAYDEVLLEWGGIFRSTVLPGFWIKLEWLWQEPLPKLKTILQEWGLV